jgi:hypothetical protein
MFLSLSRASPRWPPLGLRSSALSSLDDGVGDGEPPRERAELLLPPLDVLLRRRLRLPLLAGATGRARPTMGCESSCEGYATSRCEPYCCEGYVMSCMRRAGDGEPDRLVDTVEAERERDGEPWPRRPREELGRRTGDAERERARLLPPSRRSPSMRASVASAAPGLRSRSAEGASCVSLGLRRGLASCCVREGRALYGRSEGGTVHSKL